MPRAYIEMILSSKPVNRLCPLATILGSKLPCRSRGVPSSSSPKSPFSTLRPLPFRLFPLCCPAGSCFSYPRWSVSSACSARSRIAFVSCFSRPFSPMMSSGFLYPASIWSIRALSIAIGADSPLPMVGYTVPYTAPSLVDSVFSSYWHAVRNASELSASIISIRSQKYMDRRFVPLRFSKSCLQPPLLPGFYPHSQGSHMGPVHVGVRSQTRPHHNRDGTWLVGCCHLIGDLPGSGHYPQSPEQGEWMSLLQTFPITNRPPRHQRIFCSLGFCLFAIASLTFMEHCWIRLMQPLLVLSWFRPPCDV